MDRAVVFMDYQNVHGWARRLFQPLGAHPAVGHIDPLGTARLILSKRKFPAELAQVRVYRGRPNPERQAGAARANDRQTSSWERSGLVTVIRRNLSYPSDWPDRPPMEKGIDVAIATDMLRLAMRSDMDVAILFSSDKDLLPALEVIREDRLCHLEVASFSGAPRVRFEGEQMPWCHHINEQEYRTIEDHVDYSAR